MHHIAATCMLKIIHPSIQFVYHASVLLLLQLQTSGPLFRCSSKCTNSSLTSYRTRSRSLLQHGPRPAMTTRSVHYLVWQ